EDERLFATHPDAQAFLRGLKTIGAHLPRPGHRPLSPGDLRRVLRRLGADVTVTWHILYGRWEKAP
ncbi:MAG: ATP-dependent dethiobiotin synthetase BioD, partial [Alphaproteobacteria bacterium]|nr:ATP-dependent dethiobiotin synthetase BioD [Alphaproteobacteria bacterium]